MLYQIKFLIQDMSQAFSFILYNFLLSQFPITNINYLNQKNPWLKKKLVFIFLIALET